VRDRVADAELSIHRSRIRAVADLHDLPTVDIVVLAADGPRDIADVVWAWARPRRIPMTAAAVGLEQGWWGPLLRPAAGECWWCFERSRHAALTPLERRLEQRTPDPTPHSFGPSNGIVAALLTHDIVQFLAVGDTATAGSRSHLDLTTMTTTRHTSGRCRCDVAGSS